MKKKMSSKRYRAIMIPLLSILGVFALAASIGMNMFASSMEMFFGKGSKNTVAVQTVVDGDTDYYKSRYTSAEESVAAGYEVARQVFEEGCILLKNSNALPLEKKANVMPFGYA